MKRGDNWNKIIVITFSVVFILLWFYSLTVDNHYKWDFFFIMILLLGIYFIKDKIMLHPLHYFLFALFLLSHDLGMFGTYSNYYFGLEYDLYVHSYFGFVASLMLYRTYSLIGPYKGPLMYIAIIALLLGFSAFHELFEYAGALTVGEGEGVLFVGAGDIDEWDTQKDMFNNMWGGGLGILIYSIFRYIKPQKKEKLKKKK